MKKAEPQTQRHDHGRLSGGDLCGGRWSDTRAWYAGRGIITALEKLKETGAYETYKPDIVLYDVLGMLFAGLFHANAKRICGQSFIITSGENMAIHAGANIAMAVQNFRNRGYACLGGIILNRRNVKREEEKSTGTCGRF